jgi:tetratricopeptide (TPR) repeat protein
MHSVTPKRLGDFELLRELGRGGMGIVYEARQVSLNRKVALKVLSGGLGLTSKAVQRFRREAEAAAKLHHTNIVPVYATGEEDGTHFYAMELIDGPSLDHVIRQMRDGANAPKSGEAAKAEPEQPATVGLGTTGPFTPEATTGSGTTSATSSSLGSGSQYFDTVARLMAEVADALEYAHKEGVIHRDIKPSNLLVSPAGRFSLNDFGLARMLEQPGMTMTGEFVGTPAYMSPEQITAGRAPLNHRTDIYSLGATLYELLTLQRPFTGERRDEVIAQIMHKEPKAPRKLNPKVPVDLETICLKCMEKDPDRRYQTAGELAEDLRRYVNRFAISAKRAGVVQQAVKWVKRHPGISGAAACALGLAIAAGILANWLQTEKQQRVADKQKHEEQLQEQKRQQALDKALLAAHSGDFEGADRAVDEAEVLGAAPGLVRILRGQVALDRGDAKKAVDHLQQALKLMPQSVSAKALLASAYHAAGETTLYMEASDKLEGLSPVTAEDYLFMGRLFALDDAVRARDLLEEAVRRLPGSGVARLNRVWAQVFWAQETAKTADTELAVRYANTATDMLPGNIDALIASVFTHLTAATTFAENELLEKRLEALEKAGRDVKALETATSSPQAISVRVLYFDYLGDKHDDAFLRECRRARQTTTFYRLAYLCTSGLYRRGKFPEARDLLEQQITHVVSKTPYLALLGCVVAELPNGDSELETVLTTIAKESASSGVIPYVEYEAQMLLRLLGQKSKAEEACRQARAKRPFYRSPTRPEWFKKLFEYQCGDLSNAQLLLSAGSSRWNQCEGHFWCGMNKLAEGDRRGARESFRKSIATGVFSFFECYWSRAFLSRMDAEPAWPRWIPLKEIDSKP